MKSIVIALLTLGTALLCRGEQILAQYDGRQMSQSAGKSGGVEATIDGRTALILRNTNETALHAQFLKIDAPKIKNTWYAVVGEVKYEGVKGDGFLEMWNVFPPAKPGGPEGQYFSRTVDPSGPTGTISGTSDWRPFMLPFNRTGAPSAPTRLELNLVLPSSGTVYLAGVKLVEYPEGSDAWGNSAAATVWWSDQTAGWIGGIAGTLLGCLGSLIALLAARGRARGFVLVVSWVLICLGALSFLTGIIAVAIHQPYAVWFPLLLIGVLLPGIFSFRLCHYHQHYDQIAIRRMVAEDSR